MTQKEYTIQQDYKKAIALIRSGDILDAITILKEHDDRYYVNKLKGVLTPSERVAIVSELENTVKDGKYYTSISHWSGKKESVENDISVTEIFNILSNDEEAFFYPIHPDFEYNPTTNKKTIVPGCPRFIPHSDVKCSINNFTWHKEELNLSLLCKMEGTINIPDKIYSNGVLLTKPKSLGIVHRTFQWKNYNLIFNGELNIDKLPITASIETLEKLAKIDGSSDDIIDSDLVYLLDLTMFPLINKKDLSTPIYAKNIFNLAIDELVISGKQKIFKSLYELYKVEPPNTIKGYTEEESNYLTACSIKKDGSFSPPMKESEKKTIDTVLFKIDIKGYSSIPSLSDLIDKEEKSKSNPDKYTPPMLLARSALIEYEESVSKKSTDDKLEWLDNKIKENKQMLREIKKQMQKEKMILLLGKTWFKDMGVSTSEQVVTVKTDKLPGKEEVNIIIRVHREEKQR